MEESKDAREDLEMLFRKYTRDFRYHRSNFYLFLRVRKLMFFVGEVRLSEPQEMIFKMASAGIKIFTRP